MYPSLRVGFSKAGFQAPCGAAKRWTLRDGYITLSTLTLADMQAQAQDALQGAHAYFGS